MKVGVTYTDVAGPKTHFFEFDDLGTAQRFAEMFVRYKLFDDQEISVTWKEDGIEYRMTMRKGDEDEG